VSVPFAVLPIPLTIAAPDVYGGFVVHLVWMIALAAGGAALALALALVRPPRVHIPPTLRDFGVRLLFGVLLSDAVLRVLGPAVADVSLRITSIADVRALSNAVLGPGAVTSFAAALLLVRLLRRPASRTEALAALWGLGAMIALPIAAAWGFGALGVWPPSPAYPLALLGLAAGWTRVRARVEASPPLLRAGLALQALLLLSAVAATVTTGPERAKEALLGLWTASTSTPLLAAAVLALVARAVRAAGSAGAGLPAVAASSVIAAVAFAAVPGTAAVAPALTELLGLPSPAGAAEPPVALSLAWIGVCISAFHGARGGPALARARALTAAVWLALLASMAMPSGWGSLRWLLPAAAAGAALLLPDRHRRPALVALVDRLPLAAAGAFAGAFLGASAGRSLVPVLLSAPTLASLGGVLGAAAGWASASADLGARDPLRRTARRLLVLLGLALPMFVAIGQVLAPLPVGLAAAALFGWAVVSSRSGWRGPRVRPWVALWLLFYVAYGAVQLFKLPPGEGACAAALGDGRSRVLLDSNRAGDAYASAAPYDIVPHPGSNSVVTSFKRIDGRNGFLEVMSRAVPEHRSRLPVLRREGALFPERLVGSRDASRLFAQYVGAGASSITELDVRPGDAEIPQLAVLARIPIRWEPGNPWLDERRDRVVVSYVPNFRSDNPLLEAFSTSAPYEGQRTTTSVGALQMADFVAGDPHGDSYFVPALADLVRFPLVEIDAETLALRRVVPMFHPAIGLAVDVERGWLFLTNPLAGTVETLDLGTLSILDTVYVGRFPRDVEYDRARGILHVAAYGTGQVTSLRVGGPGERPLEVARRVPTGRILRGIGVDPNDGRVYAASGCGVFELPPVGGTLPASFGPTPSTLRAASPSDVVGRRP
jgi:hypothetical protein